MFDSRKLALALVAAVAASAAQADGDVERGRVYVESACAGCHAVQGGQSESPDPNAIPFAAVAQTSGIASPSLFMLLRTSHETMPNIVIQANDLEDVVAYILSLKK